MKKLIALVVLLCGFMPVLWAADGCDQHLSREEFRNKQRAFIIEQAGLTKEEAAKFFPVYFELQEKKKKLNDESWSLMRQGKDDKTTEAQYEEIVAKVCDNRIAADRQPEFTQIDCEMSFVEWSSTSRSCACLGATL